MFIISYIKAWVNDFFVFKYEDFIMNTKQYLGAFNNIALNVHVGEVVSLDSSWRCNNVRSPFTRLYYIKSGSGYIETENERIEMTAGNVYVIPSEHIFSSGCEKLDKIYFHITVTSVERYDILSRLEKIQTVNCGSDFVEEIERCFCSDNYSDMIKLHAMLYTTVSELMEPIDTPVVYYSPLVEKVMSYINRHLSVKLTSAEIANRFFVSVSKLRNTFKEETGMPLGKYIDDMVFIKAKQMLTREGSSIADISAKLGFCDRFYFSGRFSEKFGVSPGKFREQNREGQNSPRIARFT